MEWDINSQVAPLAGRLNVSFIHADGITFTQMHYRQANYPICILRIIPMYLGTPSIQMQPTFRSTFAAPLGPKEPNPIAEVFPALRVFDLSGHYSSPGQSSSSPVSPVESGLSGIYPHLAQQYPSTGTWQTGHSSIKGLIGYPNLRMILSWRQSVLQPVASASHLRNTARGVPPS